ncbi:hypothetical protein, partial [Vibrio parahaemolyticus]
MYELNINHLNVNGFMDVHTIDVPITGDSLEITDKEHALFRVSRMNKVCSKTGVQALGPSSTFQVINDK